MVEPSNQDDVVLSIAGSFGELAVEKGFVTREQVDECLDKQAQLIQQGQNRRLGEIMLEAGYLLPHQLDAVVKDQQKSKTNLRVKNYELIAKIGEGGMGTVFKARRDPQGTIVALKVLFKRLADDETFIARFKQEAEIGLKLDHPNLVKCLEWGDADGLRFMALEYVDGEDLSVGLQRRNRYPEGQALAICLSAARGMSHAHKHSLIHRDVKPANIMLTRKGEVKVMDFGLARQVLSHDQRITLSGVLMGTPHYISPEQVDGKTEIDGRSDIYGLGLTLYHMLTGRPPFIGSNLYEILKRHATEDIPDPRTFNKDLSKEVSEFVMDMSRRNPDERLSSMDVVVARLRKVMGFPTGDWSTGQPISMARTKLLPANRAAAKPSPPTEQEAAKPTGKSEQRPRCPRCSALYEGDPLLLGHGQRIRCIACGLVYVSDVNPTAIALRRQSGDWTNNLKIEEPTKPYKEDTDPQPSPWRPHGPGRTSWITIDAQSIAIVIVLGLGGYFGYGWYADYQANREREQQALEVKRKEAEEAQRRLAAEKKKRELAEAKARADKRAQEEERLRQLEAERKRAQEQLRLERERAQERIRLEAERRLKEQEEKEAAAARERAKRESEARRKAEEERRNRIKWVITLRDGRKIEAQNMIDAGHEVSIKDADGKFHIVKKKDIVEKIKKK